MKTMCVFLIILAGAAAIDSAPARAQDSGCPMGVYECLRLTAVCSQQWRVTNPNDIPVEAYWQIWSAYEYPLDNDLANDPIILYEGILNLRPRQTVTFRTPVARPVVVVWGPMGGGAGPLSPSPRPCDVPPPFSCTNVFKIAVPEHLRSPGAEFVLYHIGDVFLDTYADADLGFEIRMGALGANGQTALLLCDNPWPGSLNFVGMVEIDGSRTKIIEFTLSPEWPGVQVYWTAPGVENAP